jgi:integrase
MGVFRLTNRWNNANIKNICNFNIKNAGENDGAGQTGKGHYPATRSGWPVIYSTRNQGLSAAAIKECFARLYRTLGMDGCSSPSRRRTFITRAARQVSVVGGSLRDVQQLAGHASLAITQRYIEGDTAAKRKLVARV